MNGQQLNPNEFVRQVYYAQTGVRLDFWRDDDKYREVLEEANLVLQELQQLEDWHWLRERVILGSTGHAGSQPEYDLPARDIYKICTDLGDSVRLYRRRHPHGGHHGGYRHGTNVEDYTHELFGIRNPGDDLTGHFDEENSHMFYNDGHPGWQSILDEENYLEVPIVSPAQAMNIKTKHAEKIGSSDHRDRKLLAFVVGNVLTFSRPLHGRETHRIAVTDAIMRLPMLHICTELTDANGANGRCKPVVQADPKSFFCEKARLYPFKKIPDPAYVVFRTAYLRAETDPTVSPTHLMTLKDRADKMLSAMRENNYEQTTTDSIEYSPWGFIEVT